METINSFDFRHAMAEDTVRRSDFSKDQDKGQDEGQDAEQDFKRI